MLHQFNKFLLNIVDWVFFFATFVALVWRYSVKALFSLKINRIKLSFPNAWQKPWKMHLNNAKYANFNPDFLKKLLKCGNKTENSMKGAWREKNNVTKYLSMTWGIGLFNDPSKVPTGWFIFFSIYWDWFGRNTPYKKWNKIRFTFFYFFPLKMFQNFWSHR